MNFGPVFLHWMIYHKQSVRVLLEGLESQVIHIARGVRQGCTISPLLFDIAIEILANAIRDCQSIQGLKYSSYETKPALYADDVVLFVQSPLDSVIALTKILDKYSEISGYKVNEKKSRIMGLNIKEGLRKNLQVLYKVPWDQKGIWYLSSDLLANNVLSYKNNFKFREPL